MIGHGFYRSAISILVKSLLAFKNRYCFFLDRSVPSFSRTASVLAMYTLRDDILEAVQHRSHVCYCPLESQHQNRSGMVIQKDFSSIYMSKAFSHSMDHTNGVSFRVRAQIDAVVSAIYSHRATETLKTCYISRRWHIADSLHFGFVSFQTIQKR